MLLSLFGHMLSFAGGVLEYPTLPANAVRFKFVNGINPSSATYIGTWLQKSEEPNIWDCFPDSNSWSYRFNHLDEVYGIHGNIEIIGMNMSGVTDATGAFHQNPTLVSVSGITRLDPSLSSMYQMFSRCPGLVRVEPFYSDLIGVNCAEMFAECVSLVAVPSIGVCPYKTSRMFYGCSSLVNMPNMWMNLVSDASYMYFGCTSLASIDSSYPGNYSEYLSISNADRMFYNCVNVASGIIDLYNVWTGSPHLGNPSHLSTFYNCGINSVTGSAELAQIPADWK